MMVRVLAGYTPHAAGNLDGQAVWEANATDQAIRYELGDKLNILPRRQGVQAPFAPTLTLPSFRSVGNRIVSGVLLARPIA
jgi:hypothetical protein